MKIESTAKTLDEKMPPYSGKEILLPFFHSCDAFFLRSILEQGHLAPTECKVFNEKLLYLFYGRPAYKNLAAPTTGIGAYLPVCFILSSDAVQNITRIAPFDTGAYKNDLYLKFLHPHMEMTSFFLSPTKDSISKTVEYFFETNHKYFSCTPKISVQIDPLDFEMESYYALIKGVAADTADDRKATIEIQVSEPIELKPENLKAIIIPEHFVASPLVRQVLIEQCKIDILTYDCYGVRSSHHYTEILGLAKKYLKQKNYLHAS